MAQNPGEVRENSVNSPASANIPQTAAKRKRQRLFKLLALACALLPFVICELTLRFLDVGATADHDDPFVGFSAINPLFELDKDTGIYRTARNRGRFFNTQEFAQDKPTNTFRTFALGGSTVRGRPYETDSSFPEWLRIELAGRNPESKFESINCGGLSYASYRLVPIVREVLNYDPDLIVVATGHNEFLEDRTYESIKDRSGLSAWLEDKAHSLRTVTFARSLIKGDQNGTNAKQADDGRTVLKGDVDAKLDQASGYASYHYDKEWRARVVDHFDISLRKMVELCNDADVPIVFVRMSSNLRDCPPFKSEHAPDVSAADEQQWQKEFALADRAKKPADALQHYRKCESIAEEHALLAFRIARTLDRLNRADEAAEYYLKAREWDICPLRLTEPLDQALLAVTKDTQTPLVDIRSEIESRAMDGIPGNDWFMDHVHPNITAHQRIGQLLAEKLIEMKVVKDNPDWTPSVRRRTYHDYYENDLGANRFLANGGRRVQWLENWARRQRLFEETLPFTAREHLHYGQRAYDFNDEELAWDSYQLALEKDSATSSRRVLIRARRLFEGGRSYDAAELLEMLQSANIIEATKDIVWYASLIVCVELSDAKTAQELLSQRSSRTKPAGADDWEKLMPDVFERLTRLTQ